MKRIFPFLIAIFLLSGCGGVRGTLQYPPVRWLDDADRRPIERSAGRRDYKYWDIVEKHFFHPLKRMADLSWPIEMADKQEALNVNNFDEVADSTWFTNRIGRHDLPPKIIARGPNQGNGPDPGGRWLILSAKTIGLTPGFLIRDRKGDRYLLKFDPPGFSELASGAEVISTRLFHAFGYNVPENSVVFFDRKILKLSPEATRKDKHGKKFPFTSEDLEKILEKVEKGTDGRTRALASRLLEGEPLGPFSLQGRRRDDVNDRIPHEHRRELRGYRVFSAFLNHQDSREANALDTFIKTHGEQGYVRHSLIDFGGTIGSGGVRPKGKEHLYDYRLNYGQTLGSLVSMGVFQPEWERTKDPGLPSVGLIESELFRPERWRPTYINPVFLRMTSRDGFWAAKIVMRLSDEALAAVVDEARYSDPRARDEMIRVLRERRDKIGRTWFSKINPLDEFDLRKEREGYRLSFADLAVRGGIGKKEETVYRYRVIDSRNGFELAPWQFVDSTHIGLTSDLVDRFQPGRLYFVQIQTKRREAPWSSEVDAVLSQNDGPLQLIGLNRR